MTPAHKDRLGRGLGALLGDYAASEDAPAGDVAVSVAAASRPKNIVTC